MAFPNSPTNGQIVLNGGVNYQYNSTTGTWTRLISGGVSNATFDTVAANVVTVNGSRVVSSSSGAGNLVISNGAINLATIGPGVATNGSATTIPVITTDAYGRISAITTASPSLTLNLSGTSGTGSVAANGGTLTFASTNGITATASSNTVTINSPQDLRTSASPTFAGLTATGALTVGAGITASSTTYYTFNKPSPAGYQTTALFGSTAGGLFLTSDSAIIGKGAYYNNGWIATSTSGSLIDLSGTAPSVAYFSGATVGNSISMSSNYPILHSGNYTSYSPSLTGSGASGTWGINITGSAAGGLTGGTVSATTSSFSGLMQISNNTSINTTTPGLSNYGLHFTGQTTADYAAGITWNGGTGTTGAQAGIYVQGSGSYGTKMYLATTSSYATGAMTALSIDHTGAVVITRSTLTTNSAQIASLGVGTAASGTSGEIRATNQITAYYSDERLKNKIGKIENALDKVDQLSGFLYVENDLARSLGFNNTNTQVALSAQDVQVVQPEAVKPAPFDIAEDGSSKSGENYLTVQYDKLVPLLVEAIKELRVELNTIKAQLRG